MEEPAIADPERRHQIRSHDPIGIPATLHGVVPGGPAVSTVSIAQSMVMFPPDAIRNLSGDGRPLVHPALVCYTRGRCGWL